MHASSRSGSRFRPGLCFILFCGLAAVLWVAGGASRSDVPAQAVVRTAATVVLVAAILFAPRFPPTRTIPDAMRPLWWIVGAAVALVLLQLVPLPPAVWQALPGRALFAQVAPLTGQPQPWRPLSIVPGATANAGIALIVPVAVLALIGRLSDAERARLPAILLGLVAASMCVGLLQFTGVVLRNPLVNDSPGQVSGLFANRNHFAILLACGCMLAPVWAFLDGRRPVWRGPVALGLVLLFTMTILATGSRGGLLVGVVALGLGLAMVQQGIRRILDGAPRWAFPALIAGLVGAIAILVLLSVAADRAISIQRAFASEAGQDMRGRSLPTVLAMVRTYFPAGTGLGGFDPMFRIHEPVGLLKFTYFNRAHNDWLEIALDAGLPGVLLLAAAVTWWARASIRAWRAGAGTRHALPKLGSAIVLLVMIASAFDYPARTPMVMALLVVAGTWLAQADAPRGAPALPRDG